MSKELIKAAQQALDALKTCSEHLAGTRFKHKEFNTDKVGKARSTLERALATLQAQPASKPEPDTCRKRPRCGRADPCAWLEKQPTSPESKEGS